MSRKDGKPSRISQIGQAYTVTHETDPQVWVWMLGAFALPLVLGLGVGFAIGHPWTFGALGFSAGLLAMTVIFGRRAERAAYKKIEGQPGAAVAPLNVLRRGWTVTPAVAVTRQQDVLHRAVGRPGIVLVGEGQPTRVSGLMAQERRKIGRVAPETPVHEFVVGDGEGQIQLRKLQNKVSRLRRTLSPAQVREVNQRLKALGAQQGVLPVPKGPLPKSARMPKAPR